MYLMAYRVMSLIQVLIIKAKSGQLFFGGIKGLNAFYPDDIKDNPYVTPIVITDFQIFNESVKINKNPIANYPNNGNRKPFTLEKHITETSKMVFSYRESVFFF